MALTRQQKAAKATLDKAIETFYYRNAIGVQISIMDIGKIYQAGYEAVHAGEPLEPAIVAAIAKYRQN